MRRWLPVAVVLAVCLLLATTAWAAVFRASRVYDLRAVSHSGKVVLTWKVNVKKDVGPMFGDTEITISRGRSEQSLKKVATIPVPKTPGDGIAMSWTDSNVSPGERWYYRVSSGDVAARKQFVWVTVSDAPPGPGTGPGDAEPGDADGCYIDERRKQYEESADWPERLAGSIVMAIPNWLMKVLGLYDPVELIFQVRLEEPLPGAENLDDPASARWLHTFTDAEVAALDKFYSRVSEFVPLHLVVVLVILAIGIWWSQANPGSKLTFREYLVGFLLGVFILKFGVSLLSFVFDVNWAIVKEFQYVVDDKLGTSFLATLYNEENKALGNAGLAFIAVFCVGLINWQYTMRKVSIALLLGLLPIVAVVSIPPSNRHALSTWFKELLSNVFLQAGHAAALAFLILLVSGTGECGVGFWVKLAALMGLPAMASLVRRIMGAETYGGVVGMIGGVLGLGAMFALGRMLMPGRKASGEGFLPSFAGTAAGAGAGLVGTMAGSMVAGAAGVPGLGIGAGALAGTALGRGIAGTIGHAASFGLQAARGEARLGNLYDPAQAYGAGQKILGPGLAGKTAGGIMAAGSWFAGKLRPEAAGAAISSRKEFLAMQEGLETGRERLAEARLGFEAARAEHDYAQAMYSPQSFHMRELQDELSRRDQARAEAEIGYLEAAQAVEESPLWRRREAVEQLASSYGDYVAADHAYGKVQTEIKTGEAMREAAARKFEASRAAYARQRMEVGELEKRLREHPLYGQFVNLKQQRTPGGLDGRWR